MKRSPHRDQQGPADVLADDALGADEGAVLTKEEIYQKLGLGVESGGCQQPSVMQRESEAIGAEKSEGVQGPEDKIPAQFFQLLEAQKDKNLLKPHKVEDRFLLSAK